MTTTTAHRFGVGIVGLQAGRSWAARAHIPALRSLPDSYEIVGVANTTKASAERAAGELGLPTAFTDVAALIASADVDIVAVTVKVPHHLEIVKAVLAAGKHVYCEWPLGNGLAEATELAALARAGDAVAVVGTQAVASPTVRYLKHLIDDGHIGEILSTTLVGSDAVWSGVIPDEASAGYLLDATNGATMLTIPFGHTLAAVRHVLGDVTELSATLATRRTTALATDTGNTLPVTAPDQILVNGTLERGAPISVHYRGRQPRDGEGLQWEINGTDGDLRVTAPRAHTQLAPLTVHCARGDDDAFAPVEVPASYDAGIANDPLVGNVARMYDDMARDVRDGTHTAPGFDDAVALHTVLDGIERSAASGPRWTNA